MVSVSASIAFFKFKVRNSQRTVVQPDLQMLYTVYEWSVGILLTNERNVCCADICHEGRGANQLLRYHLFPLLCCDWSVLLFSLLARQSFLQMYTFCPSDSWYAFTLKQKRSTGHFQKKGEQCEQSLTRMSDVTLLILVSAEVVVTPVPSISAPSTTSQ